jgi:hypothetical protein
MIIQEHLKTQFVKHLKGHKKKDENLQRFGGGYNINSFHWSFTRGHTPGRASSSPFWHCPSPCHHPQEMPPLESLRTHWNVVSLQVIDESMA